MEMHWERHLPLATGFERSYLRRIRIRSVFGTQCAGLVLKQETPSVDNQIYVTRMPPPLPGDSQEAQLGLWWALYGTDENDDPEWRAAVKRILELAANKKKPETL
jgi:hypothetical protein